MQFDCDDWLDLDGVGQCQDGSVCAASLSVEEIVKGVLCKDSKESLVLGTSDQSFS